MLKSIILVAALIPTAATAHHEWNQNDWVLSLLKNHNAIVECLKNTSTGDFTAFRTDCMSKIDEMAEEEVKVERLYHEAKTKHTELTDMEFIKESFPGSLESSYESVVDNIKAIPNVKKRLIDMYILTAVMRGDKY